MAYYAWTFGDSSASITNVVRSMTYTLGRKSPDDMESTVAAQITLINNNEATFPLTYNETVGFSFTIGATTYAEISGRVVALAYDDEPGTGVNSSVTATLFNALGLNSQVELTGSSIGAGTIAQQIATLNTLIDLDVNYLPSGGTSPYTMAAQTYTGSPTDYIRTLSNADNATLYCRDYSNVNYWSYAQGFVKPPVTIGRTATSTQLGYSSIRRRKFANPFYNQVTVTSTSVASQTQTNATSVTAYGKKAFNLDTFYDTTTQAADAASWYANAWSTEQFCFEADFFVDTQNQTMWTQAGTATTAGIANASSMATCVFGGLPTYLNVLYRAPGAAADTTVPCILEGVTINATPNGTYGTLYLTPATFYSRFILDNSYFGILDTDRLGW